MKVFPSLPAESIDWLDGLSLTPLQQAFALVGGWNLQLTRAPERTGEVWSMPLENRPGGYRLALLPPVKGDPSLEGISQAPPESTEGRLASARALAMAVGGLLTEVVQLRRALWQREAELAAGVPVLVPTGQEHSHLAERLTAVLRGGAQAVGCPAAGLYLLDEATTCLKLRAAWGLPTERLLDPPRALKGALADLEALAGHAVVLEDTRLLTRWRCPEAFAAAACVPVSTATIPLGTLWVFSDRPRDFSAEQTQMLEIVAGRIASDLEREMLLIEAARAKATQQAQAAAVRWLSQRRPALPPLCDEFQVAGASWGEEPSGGFYDWFGLSDGSILVVAGRAPGKGLEGALAALTVQAVLRAHAETAADLQTLLAATDATLRAASPGEAGSSLVMAQVRPGCRAVTLAGAGAYTLWTLRGSQWHPSSHRRPGLGGEESEAFRPTVHQWSTGQALGMAAGVLGADRPLRRTVREARGRSTSLEPGGQAVEGGRTAEQLLRALRRRLERALPPSACDGGLVVLRRRG